MPLKRCVNAEGKKGWSWGDGGCQVAGSDLESKKQAIRVGLKVEGPHKFSKIMKHEGTKAFYDTAGLIYAKAVHDEHVKTEKAAQANAFKSIATYLSSKADGDNDSDKNLGDVLDDKTSKGSDYVDNGSSLSNNAANTGDGNGNEFNEPAKKKASSGVTWDVHTGPEPENSCVDEKGETVYDPQKKPAEASLTWKVDTGEKPSEDFTEDISPDSKASLTWKQNTPNNSEDYTCHPDTETVNDPQKPAKSDVNSDKYGKHPEGMDNDGDEPDPQVKASLKDGKPTETQVDKNDPDNNDESLDKPREKVGSTGVVPPYNKSASPESKSNPVADYPTYTKKDASPSGNDNRQTLDPKIQYEVKNPRSGKAEMSPKSDDVETTMADKTITNIPEGEDIVRKSVVGNVYSSDTEEAESPQSAGAGWENACAYISEKERDKVPEENFAGPKGSRSYPIRNGKDVEDAARLVGHSPSPTQTKKRIIEIAHRLGLQAHLPESWKKPEHQTASAYEEALALLNKLPVEERNKLKAAMDFQMTAVNKPSSEVKEDEKVS